MIDFSVLFSTTFLQYAATIGVLIWLVRGLIESRFPKLINNKYYNPWGIRVVSVALGCSLCFIQGIMPWYAGMLAGAVASTVFWGVRKFLGGDDKSSPEDP